MLNQYFVGSIVPSGCSAISGLSFLILLMSPVKNTLPNESSDPGCTSNVPANCHPPASLAAMPPLFNSGLLSPNGSSYTALVVRRYGLPLLSSCQSVGARSYSSTVRFDLTLANESPAFAVNPFEKRRFTLICSCLTL